MNKPIAIDLCCGKGGWTIGLQKAGFRVIGFDITRYDYPGELVLQDVRTPIGEQFKDVALIVASSPCTEFSRCRMKMFHPNAPYPAQGIELFRACEKVCIDSGVPYILENVAGAQKFVGKAQNHCGPFYFWGTGLPAIFPESAYRVSKGFDIGRDPITGARHLGGGRRFSSKSKKRPEWSATVAMIPEVIYEWVGRVHFNKAVSAWNAE